MDKSYAYRCSDCDVNWPHVTEFRVCPICREESWRSDGEIALAITEARKLSDTAKASHARHEAFEAHYADREVAKLGAAIEEWGVLDHDPHEQVKPAFEEKAFQKFLNTVGFIPEDS